MAIDLLGPLVGDGEGDPAHRLTRAIEILRQDIVRTLTLLGIESTRALDRSSVDFPRDWLRADR